MEKEVELFSFDSAAQGGYCFRTALDERWVARPIGVDACDASSSTLVGVYAILRRNGPAATKPARQEGDLNGVAYRVPGRGALRVFARKADGSEYDYLSAGFDIAQFGTVRFLPTKLGNSSSYNVGLDPMTGALKSVTIGVKPLLSGDSAKQLDDLSGSLLGIVDAVHAAKKKPSAFETAQGEEQLKLEQLKIQMIESCKTDPSQSFCATLFK